MLHIRHILFPYDFSDQGRQVAPFVRSVAGAFGARITVFSVVPPTFDSVPDGMGTEVRIGLEPDQWRRALQERLDLAFVDEFAGLTVERVAACGDAAFRITDFAHGHGVDLVMMPTHGLGLFRTVLLGSVTSKVLHDTESAVWTAAHAEVQTAPPTPRTILCAVDAGSATPAVLQQAAEFGATLGAALRVLHVVDRISDWPSLERERRLQEQVRAEAERQLEVNLKAAGVDVPFRAAVGDVAATVTEEARQDGADLIVIGRGSAAEPFGTLRTHVFGIVQRAPCPVLSVPGGDQR